MSETTPFCPVFGRCGGCQHQNIPYDEELLLKERMLRNILGAAVDLSACSFGRVIPSPRETGYRHRLDLKLLRWRDGSIHIGFSPAGPGAVIEVDACPIAMDAVSSFIPKLRQEAVQALPPKYKMANLTVRCGEENIVRWGGIGRGSLRMEPSEYFHVTLQGSRIFYSMDTFFQGNLSILPVLADTLRSLPVWSEDATFYDLYGGVGLFSLLVRDLVSKVVDIEENEHAVKLARHNMMANKAGNMDVLEGRVEDILPPLLDRDTGGKHILMVDPPRAGVGVKGVELLTHDLKAQHLIYLSCGPEALAEDLKGLLKGGWSLERVQPFDFFPRTRHVETLVHLTKHQGPPGLSH